MISLIKGKIININKNTAIIMTTAGLGYDVCLTPIYATSLQVNQEIELFTYLKVSETALELYGFKNIDEKEFFILLLSVSGIGPKGAMNVLALGSIEQIQSAISRGDVAYLTQVKGMGKKTAERAVVELKTKLKNKNLNIKNNNIDGSILSEVLDGLVAMGYSKDEAKQYIAGLETKGKTTEELLREILKKSI